MFKSRDNVGYFSVCTWIAGCCFLLTSLTALAQNGLTMPPLPDALVIEGLDQILENATPDLRTSGINHVVGQDVLGESVSTLSLDFEFVFQFGDSENAVISKCGSGCRLPTAIKGSKIVKADGQMFAEQPVVIYRFATDGSLTLQDGTTIDWLVRMVEGETLRGTFRLPLNERGEAVYPGEMELDGKMIITMQVAGEAPVNLLSEIDSSLIGEVYEWPPRGTQFSLRHQVPYYDAGVMAPSEPDEMGVRTMRLLDSMTAPTITILENNTRIGDQAWPFLSVSPDITRTRPVGHTALGRLKNDAEREKVAGLYLEWTDTAARINGDSAVPVERYHIYRNADPGNLEGWRFAGSVSADQTYFVDRDWDPTRDAEYMVLNGSEFKFGYLFEGSPGTPTKVRKLIR